MYRINLSNIRIAILLSLLIGISYLFTQIFFIVTNSDVNEFIPYGQAQLTFERSNSCGFEANTIRQTVGTRGTTEIRSS